MEFLVPFTVLFKEIQITEEPQAVIQLFTGN